MPYTTAVVAVIFMLRQVRRLPVGSKKTPKHEIINGTVSMEEIEIEMRMGNRDFGRGRERNGILWRYSKKKRRNGVGCRRDANVNGGLEACIEALEPP